MADVLAPASARWARLVAVFATLAERAGFGLALTPLIEHAEVFQRVGDSTDIVRKEMYDFDDKGGRRVAVRPEITAGLMRAYASLDRRTEALAAYQRMKRLLSISLGVQPSAQSERLFQGLRLGS